MDLPRGPMGEFEEFVWVPDGTAEQDPPSEGAEPLRETGSAREWAPSVPQRE